MNAHIATGNVSNNETKMKMLWMITERGEKTFWTRIGVGFENRDGSVTLSFDAMPIGGSKIQLRDYQPRDAEDRDGGERSSGSHRDRGQPRRGDRGQGRGATHDRDNEVPL